MRDLLRLPGGESAADLVDPVLTAIDEPPVEQLVGKDPDSGSRARYAPLLDALFTEEDIHRSVLSGWETDTARDGCPVCLARERAGRRLLSWEARMEGGFGPRDAEVQMCRRHLHDFARLSGPGVLAVIARHHERVRDRWRRFQMRQERGDRAEALQHLEPLPCHVCREERSAEGRYAALVAAALLDPDMAHAHTTSHGLCLRHVMRARELLPAPALTCIRARLELTRWEVTETLRKQEWRARHEKAGAETTAAFRSTTHLDGRIGCGLPRAQQPQTGAGTAAEQPAGERDDKAPQS
ncbi:hypothetical protein [Streptomyces sp. NPDC047046]|uniref:hypothetical protein n=1 Tax=Streptomyces sp. NPDC047046 TaxID=3155378 RepID=UPI0033E861C9